jgi:NAD(P)-dependent dehydrogenase (short-subunit alcohol dehydrogenase family)
MASWQEGVAPWRNPHRRRPTVSIRNRRAQARDETGVRVNAVAPGPAWTSLIPSTMPQESVKKFGADTVFERAAQPVEIASVFVFLAFNESRYVSGEVYGVTGGKMPY